MRVAKLPTKLAGFAPEPGLVQAPNLASLCPNLCVVDELLIKKVYQEMFAIPSRPGLSDSWKILRDKIMLRIRMFRIARIV